MVVDSVDVEVSHGVFATDREGEVTGGAFEVPVAPGFLGDDADGREAGAGQLGVSWGEGSEDGVADVGDDVLAGDVEALLGVVAETVDDVTQLVAFRARWKKKVRELPSTWLTLHQAEINKKKELFDSQNCIS